MKNIENYSIFFLIIGLYWIGYNHRNDIENRQKQIIRNQNLFLEIYRVNKSEIDSLKRDNEVFKLNFEEV